MTRTSDMTNGPVLSPTEPSFNHAHRPERQSCELYRNRPSRHSSVFFSRVSGLRPEGVREGCGGCYGGCGRRAGEAAVNLMPWNWRKARERAREQACAEYSARVDRLAPRFHPALPRRGPTVQRPAKRWRTG